jgi:hypothetical protein
MKIILVAALVLGLSACAKDKDNSPGGLKGGGNNQEKTENVTDYGACGNYTPRTIEGAWQMQQRAGEFNFTMVMEIYNGYLTLSNECELHGRYLTARVSSPVYYDNSNIQIYSDGYDKQTIDEAGFNMTCDVSMKQSRMKYQFRGRCLELSDGGSQKVILVPR